MSRLGWHTFFLFPLNHSPHTVSAKWLTKFLRGPPKLQHNRNCSQPPPPPPSRNKLEPWIFPHQGRTQRNPPTSPPSITSLFFQAVTTCKAFPQAEHMDLINCRSLTTLSCPNSLNCLYLNPLLHLLLLPPQPRPHSCFPTCIVLTCDRDRTSEHKPTSLGQSPICK